MAGISSAGVSSVTKRLRGSTGNDNNPSKHSQPPKKNSNDPSDQEKHEKRKRRLLRIDAKRLFIGVVVVCCCTGFSIYVYFLPYDNPTLIQLRDATHRKDRFPSVEQRIKSYMGDWYLPPCPGWPSVLRCTYVPGHAFSNNDKTKDPEKSSWKKTVRISISAAGQNASTVLVTAGNKIKPDALLFLDEPVFDFCARFTEWKNWVPWMRNNEFVEAPVNMFGYCRDVQDFLAANRGDPQNRLVLQNATSTAQGGIPLLFTFGDNYRLVLPVPHFRKTRPAASADELDLVTTPSSSSAGDLSCYSKPFSDRPTLAKTNSNDASKPSGNNQTPDSRFLGILLKLNSETHYLRIKRVDMWDIPWHRKQDTAIFRGRLTGLPDETLLEGSSETNFNRDNDDVKQCLRLARCNIVLAHRNSKLVTAKLVDTLARVPDSIFLQEESGNNNKRVNLVGSDLGMRKLLQHKAIIVLQGNDVASGLKWALYSNSVVMMPIPTVTSWALEEMLEPWKHFIPVNRDGSDAEEKMRWIIEHQEEAQRISNFGTLWIEDMLFHPDAEKDALTIQQEILKRYVSHFQ